MDKSNNRKELLQEALSKATALTDLFNSHQFQSDLLPHLDSLTKVQYIDPSLFKVRAEYEFALDKANIKAGAYKELLEFLKSQPGMVKRMIEELNTMTARAKEENR